MKRRMRRKRMKKRRLIRRNRMNKDDNNEITQTHPITLPSLPNNLATLSAFSSGRNLIASSPALLQAFSSKVTSPLILGVT